MEFVILIFDIQPKLEHTEKSYQPGYNHCEQKSGKHGVAYDILQCSTQKGIFFRHTHHTRILENDTKRLYTVCIQNETRLRSSAVRAGLS